MSAHRVELGGAQRVAGAAKGQAFGLEGAGLSKSERRGRAVEAQAASASQMGRFETETLALAANRAALADLNREA